jgi:hypothetical protein
VALQLAVRDPPIQNYGLCGDYGFGIVCLESVLLPGRATGEEVIARARAIPDSLPKGKFTAKDLDAFKREGHS